jgi:molecular chaperone GrpE
MSKKEKKVKENHEEIEEVTASENNPEQKEIKAENSEEKIQAEEKPEELSWEEKYNSLNDKYLRLSAEFDNYRKRTLKERMELIKSAGEDILINFLSVLDNMQRAQKSAAESTDVVAVKEGIDLIFKNLSDFVSQKGVKEIESIGKDFDTDLHEALTKIPAPEENLKGKVVDVIEKGYKLNDKVIRFAKVVVGE